MRVTMLSVLMANLLCLMSESSALSQVGFYLKLNTKTVLYLAKQGKLLCVADPRDPAGVRAGLHTVYYPYEQGENAFIVFLTNANMDGSAEQICRDELLHSNQLPHAVMDYNRYDQQITLMKTSSSLPGVSFSRLAPPVQSHVGSITENYEV